MAPKEHNGLVFQQCTEQAVAAYIDDVVWTLKGILRAKRQAELRVQVFCRGAVHEEWTLELQVGSMAPGDVQLVLDQIAATASYLPLLSSASSACTFKASVRLDRAMSLPAKCRVARAQGLPPLEGDEVKFHELPLLRVRVKTRAARTTE